MLNISFTLSIAIIDRSTFCVHSYILIPNHGNTESKTERTLSILWSDVQHTNADKVSLPCNQAVVWNDEPKKPKEKLQLGGIPGDVKILSAGISEKICEPL